MEAASADGPLGHTLAAFGQSVQSDLEPTLEFMSVFTALELLTKALTGAPPIGPSSRQVGLAKRFSDWAGGNPTDCDLFERIYAQRNGFAHEARVTADTGEQARQMFEKYLEASLQARSKKPSRLAPTCEPTAGLADVVPRWRRSAA